MTQAPSTAELRLAAMNLLARREQSARELREKLRRRFGEAALSAEVLEPMIDTVLEKLAQDNLQSDERFTDAFVTMRKRQGKGPLRIDQELRQKGVAGELIEAYLDSGDEEWWDLAQEVKGRRFGDQPAETTKEKARQIRFLQYRGFTTDQVRAAVDSR